jgi:hypothetical protein
LKAAEMALERWVRVVVSMGLGAYEVYAAIGDLPDSTRPELTFTEVLKVAFKGCCITEIDHSVIRRLRGEL